MELQYIHLALDFDNVAITGTLRLEDDRGVVAARWYPASISLADAKTALLVAILDGRIKLPDDVAVALDLAGPNPRVR